MENIKFQRLDGALDEIIIDEKKEKIVVDSEGKTETDQISNLIRSYLQDKEVEVEAKSIASDKIPALIVIDEDSRRMRDYMSLSANDGVSLMPVKQKFIVNTNHPLINSLQNLNTKDPELTDSIVNQLFDLTLLEQNELNSKMLSDFVLRSNELLEKVSHKTINDQNN